MEKYIPNFKQTVQVGIALLIIMAILRYAPIPENVKNMFRL